MGIDFKKHDRQPNSLFGSAPLGFLVLSTSREGCSFFSKIVEARTILLELGW